MNVAALIRELDQKIDKLQQARDALASLSGSTAATNRRRKGRRKMTAEARAKISAAAKARWAKRKTK